MLLLHQEPFTHLWNLFSLHPKLAGVETVRTVTLQCSHVYASFPVSPRFTHLWNGYLRHPSVLGVVPLTSI